MRAASLTILLAAVIFASPAEASFWNVFGRAMEDVAARDGNIIIDISTLSKMSSRHYRYQEGGQVIKFFVVRDGQGVVRAALDACRVCWKAGRGYTLADGAMTCRQCGQIFPLNRIGLATGGCDPLSFRFKTENDALIISTQELLRGMNYFPENNK